jgi:hypothetical protein
MGEKTVTVKSLRSHTYDGEDRPEGSTYDVPEEAVENLRNQKMAVPVAEAEATEKAAKETVVDPMAAGKPGAPIPPRRR